MAKETEIIVIASVALVVVGLLVYELTKPAPSNDLSFSDLEKLGPAIAAALG